MHDLARGNATATQNGPTPPDRTPEPAPRPRFPDWAII